MPPTRREQLELDELLSDIYLGIETLPDRSTVANSAAPTFSSTNNFSSNNFAASTTGGPNSSRPTNTDNYNYNHQHSAEANSRAEASDNQLRQRQQQQAHSLASIVSSSAPNTNTARRVRIIEPAEKRAKSKERGPVKYINTNKLIYHQERNPDDEYEIKIERKPNKRLERKESSGNNNNDDDDDYNDQANDYSDDELDGVTRVQYYHTTWLDRQLGRASKRRNSKELTERQVKEKAMIEELKRNLKNGAITLRQSFRGKRVGQANKSNGANNNHSNKFTESFDDQYLLAADERVKNKAKNKAVSSYRVIGSGLATLPRNYQQQSSQARERQQQARPVEEQKTLYPFDSRYEPVVEAGGQPERRPIRSQVSEASKSAGDQLKREKSNTLQATPKQTNSSIAPIHAKSSFTETMQTKPIVDSASNYSRTLPHNFNHNHLAGDRKRQQHQLLQSHYRSGSNLSASPRPFQQQAAPVSSALVHHSSTMQRTSDGQCNSPKQVDFNTRPNYGTLPARSPSRQQPAQGVLRNQNLQQQPARTEENTISSIPSATEVVRQALSRSASQASLNQLNKTINLLPSSPSPYPHSHPAQSPASPSQQLRAATPSLSPSPVQCNLPASQRAANFYNQNQTQIHNQNQNSRPQQQQVYANPHASLMQQRLDEQTRRSRNQSSIREFNELDSLLRSLSPSLNVQHTKQPVANAAPINQHSAGAHIRPGFNSQPAQPAFGYGYNQPVLARPANNSAALYAKVQKPNEPSQQAGYLQRNYQQVGNQSDPFTIDVTSRKGNDENCLEREEISEFEPPIELLPSMEDYQNISRLNPVKNHFWYKPNMSRDRAIELLKDKPQGTFIVRDSTSFRGAFGLAVKVSKLPKNVMNNSALRNTSDPSAELIRHFLIEPTSSGVRLKGYANEPIFGSLPALIYQHSLVQLALPCKLVIPRADIEDINFNYKQKQFYDEFLASKEQAKHAAYIDTTSPNGGYRKYPGDVYVHNEHRIIFE